MIIGNTISKDTLEQGGRVIGVEAPAASLRSQWLEVLLTEARNAGARTWLLDCDFEEGGPLAGVTTLFRSILPDLSSSRPDLLAKHNYELIRTLPELLKTLGLHRPTLTDSSSREEKVRHYPADRAYRILHGLVELLDSWKEGEAPWIIACDRFDHIGFMGLRFFRELLRRRGGRLRITLLVVTCPGEAENALKRLGVCADLSISRLQLPTFTQEKIDRERFCGFAASLEERVGDDPLEIEIHGTELIRLWRLAGRPDKVFQWKCVALDTYNRLGFYEDDRVYGEQVRAERELYAPDDATLHWQIFKKLFSCHISLQNGEAGHLLAQEEVIGRIEGAERKSQLCYLLAMLHARFLPAKNFDKAESYLDEGIRHLEEAEMPPDKFHFVYVFNRNGLALVRHFQGRYEEAIELCRSGYERLKVHLSSDKHRLHRSVLLYNIAQVYAAIGEHEQAILHYSAAAEMDPNYSEYFNDRGNVLLKLGRLQDALRDYLHAAELSPPYFELYTNLGQCYRRMSLMEDAEAAYSRALDLKPLQVLALLGRAQTREALGDPVAAMADYDAAISVQPDLWDAYAGRAVLRYEMGNLDESLGDLNRAVELAPEVATLYQNRATVLADLGHLQQSAMDLKTYLRLDPVAEDRNEIEQRLHTLQALGCRSRSVELER